MLRKMEMPEKKAILKIPRSLADEIDKVIDAGHFTTRVEFAREAIRKLLKEYGVSLRVEVEPRE